MREQRLFHAGHEHHVEFQAFGGVDGHHSDGLAVFGHGIHVGAQRHPLNEVRQAVRLEHSHGRLLVAFGAIGRGRLEQGIDVVVRVGVFVYNAEELLDVLDAARCLVAALGAVLRHDARLLYNGLHHLAKVAFVGLAFMDKLHEFRDGTARGSADALVGNAQLGSLQEGDAGFARDVVDMLHGGFANAALGHVDNAVRRHVVGGVHHQVQVRHNIADLGAVEEARSADKAVRHARAHQHIFKHAALRVGAVEHGNLVIRSTLPMLMLYLRGYPAALVAFVGCAVHGYLVARRLAGEQLLRLARYVIGDNRVRRRQDVAQRTVVFLQLHYVGVGIVLLEIKDVAQVGAAPRVDGLVVVAHHHDVLVRGGKQLGKHILRVVGVLILVHHDVLEAALVGLQHIGVVLQQQPGVQKQVVEIEGVQLAKPRLQASVHTGSHLPHRVGGGFGKLLGHHQVVLRLGNAVAQRLHGKALLVDVLLLHNLLYQALRVAVVVDGEALGEAHAVAVGAQDAHAHAVEGGNPHAARAGADEGIQALAHLGGCLVGERDGHDLPRGHALVFHQVGDAVREHAGFTTARARQNKQRAFRAKDRFALGAVQGIKIDGHGTVLTMQAAWHRPTRRKQQ